MTPVSRLGKQLAEIVSALEQGGITFALVGGLALAAHKVVRATQDIDLLVAVDDSERIDAVLKVLGYRCLYRNADVGNYLRNDERLDFLFARRPIARQLLGAAQRQQTSFGALPVIGAEGLIAFKLQALANDSNRAQDLADIKALIRANRTTLKLDELREYFRLFQRQELLNEILNEIS